MQTVQQQPKFGESGYRDQRCPDGTVRAARGVAHPGRKSAHRPVGKFAINVLARGELCLSLLAKVLPMQRVPWVMDLDDLRTMGTMFLALPARARVTWPKPSVKPPFSRTTG